MWSWILENLIIYVSNLVLKILGLETVKTGKIEFSCKQALYHPTPREAPFVIADLIINNLSAEKDTLIEALLEIKNNRFSARFYNPIPDKERREFIKIPFQIAPRGEGYYNRPLYFGLADNSLELKEFADKQDRLISMPAKLIIKRALSKKEYIIDVAINPAPSTDWPTYNGGIRGT